MTRRLKYHSERYPVRYPEDCQRIIKVLETVGFSVSPHEAERLWDDYSSEVYCAGWMGLYTISDEEIIEGLTEIQQKAAPSPTEDIDLDELEFRIGNAEQVLEIGRKHGGMGDATAVSIKTLEELLKAAKLYLQITKGN